MPRLTDEEIARAVVQTPWEREGDAIVREVELEDFAAAIAFVDRVAELAEAVNHHPDILVHGWNRVRLTLSTHSVGQITQADLDLASAIDATVGRVA
ncbi:MAG: 4a-hydroxytetrahydrobiopterin dehydratase [Solirubrobacteraceae bacterium]|jgi:4a-hydroxytetrahydrobiopterin dehydratase|nr:4a-hydroxytetrahydrobiopterin dehydratase [Solirubrobacteraceae bacterium]